MKYSFGNTSNININSNNNNLNNHNNNLNNNINDIFSDFNPYDVNIFLGKQNNKSSYSHFQKKQTFTEYNSNLNTIYNISPISSNYKLILNNKKIEAQLQKD